MFTSTFQLHLYPEDPRQSIPQHKLVKLLTALNFIGKAEENNNKSKRFLIGDKFLSHLCFLGCSPDIEFSPNANNAYIYVEVPHNSHRPRFTSGINVKVAHCPQCKTALTELPATLKNTISVNKTHCPCCNDTILLDQLNWRRTAYLSCCSIIIHHIYESEAVPDDQLLIPLEKATKTKWKYAYIRKT